MAFVCDAVINICNYGCMRCIQGPVGSVVAFLTSCLFQSVEAKEELDLHCAQLRGDVKMYRQQSKQTLRQLEEVVRERDKVRRRRGRIKRMEVL